MLRLANEQTVNIVFGKANLSADLVVPPEAEGIVVFAHGMGSDPRRDHHRSLARILNEYRLATLTLNLLTPGEEANDGRFDIDVLTRRMLGITRWIKDQQGLEQLPLGYLGVSTGASAALEAATLDGGCVQAIVLQGGRPDLARSLTLITVPTLFIVGANDRQTMTLNKQAYNLIHGSEKHLEIVPGANHLFEEPGTSEEAAQLAVQWFQRYLISSRF